MTPLDARGLGPERLRTLFRPNRIAIIGASDKSHFSHNVVSNLIQFGLADRMYLVNRRNPTVHGRPAVATIADIGEPVDLAFTMVPQAATLDSLSEAAAAGITNVVVMSSGYAEAGAAGRAAERELVEHAESLGVVILGPNMLGFANFVDRVPVTPVPNLPQDRGHVALLSQSGASSSAMLEFAGSAGVSLSYLVTLGNEAMVTAGHTLDFLVDDEQTRVIAIFMETVRDPDVFRQAARRARAAGKAIVVLKAGRSDLAARTAAAHTGALVGDDATISAVFADLGVIRVDTIEDMLVTAGAAAQLGRLTRPGVGVVSISGGACDIVADLAADVGLSLPPLAAPTIEALTQVMPSYGTVQNPLDTTGAAVIDPSLATTCIAAIGADPSIGVVLVINKIPWEAHEDPFGGQQFIDAIGVGAAASAAPVVFVNQVMQPITATTRAVLRRGGLDYAICGLSHAVTAIGRVAWWSQQVGPDPDASADPPPARPTLDLAAGVLPAPADRHGSWSEHQARELLASAGIPVVPSILVRSGDEAAAAAEQIGGPVAVKLVAPEIVHKSDIGGVRLGVAGPDAAREAYLAVTAAGALVPGATIEGALVAPMRTGGVELLVGVVRDSQWGPMLAVAIGGVLVEVLHDSALAPLPVTRAGIREMLSSLRAAPLLDGVRGAQPADLDAVVDAIARIAGLALALGEQLESLEVNPLRVDGAVVEALDAVVTWRETAVDESTDPSGRK
jgi:acetate---CoA ligase (ADP-forming)